MDEILSQLIEIELNAGKAGVSINKLCRVAGINRSTYTKWKSGISTPNYATFAKLKAAVKLCIQKDKKCH